MNESISSPRSGLSKRTWRVLFIVAVAVVLLGHAYLDPPRPIPEPPRQTHTATINFDDHAAPSSLATPAHEPETPPAAESSDFATDIDPTTAARGADAKPAVGSVVFRDMTIRNEDGRVVFRGDVDVRPTLMRIDAGKRLPFPHDGTVFGNREGRLPKKRAGYYREFVHPTIKLSGPGPQRIITGDDGEAFYTPDHYQSFRRVR